MWGTFNILVEKIKRIQDENKGAEGKNPSMFTSKAQCSREEKF